MTQMSVQIFMPLCLQLCCKQADVGSNLMKLPALLLWYGVTASVDAVGTSCRSLASIQHAGADAQAFVHTKSLSWLANKRRTPVLEDAVAWILVCLY